MKKDLFSLTLATLVSTSALARTIDSYIYVADCPANSVCVQGSGIKPDGSIIVSTVIDMTTNTYMRPQVSTVMIKGTDILVSGTRIGTIQSLGANHGNYKALLDSGMSLNISTAQGDDIKIPRMVCVAVDVCQKLGTKKVPGFIDTLTVSGSQDLLVQSDPYYLPN